MLRLKPRHFRYRRFHIFLPRVRVDLPKEVSPPWQQVEVDRVIYTRLNPEAFLVHVVLG